MFGSIALLATSWLVSGTAAGSPTGWVAPLFVALGLLYGAVVPTLINLDESNCTAPRFLLLCVLSPLGPLALVLWGATAWLDGSAYAYLVPWCWWTLAGCAALSAGGSVYRLRRRQA